MFIPPIGPPPVTPPTGTPAALVVTAPSASPAVSADQVQTDAARSSQPLVAVSFGDEPPGPEELERRMIALVNRDRIDNGLPPLRHDPRLTPIAMAHSTDMDENRFFAHASPRTGRMQDRYKAAGYLALASAENLARHDSLEGAEDALMHSPGHRANILGRDVTHIGIGVRVTPLGDGRFQYTITQNFAKPYVPRTDDAWRQDLRSAADAARRQAGLPPLRTNAALDAVASAAAADIAANGYDAERLKRIIRQGLTQASVPWRGFHLEYRTLQEPADARAPADAAKPDTADLGIGLVQQAGGPGELPKTVSLVITTGR